MRTLPGIPIDRTMGKDGIQAVLDALELGNAVIMFPEGERSIDGTVKRFKKGAPILSRHLNVPVVPVAIKGAHEVWPRSGAFNWRGALPWSRSQVTIQFGDSIQFSAGTSYPDAAARLRSTVDDMWQRL